MIKENIPKKKRAKRGEGKKRRPVGEYHEALTNRRKVTDSYYRILETQMNVLGFPEEYIRQVEEMRKERAPKIPREANWKTLNLPTIMALVTILDPLVRKKSGE